MTVGEPVNPTKIFSLDNFDQAVFDSLPQWMQDKINESDERKSEETSSEIDF
jgi:hypothetical protein